MSWVLAVGLLMNAIALPLAARRVAWITRFIRSGQPAPDRVEGVRERVGAAVKRQVVEVLGQKKLLEWSVPGAAHFFVMWAFFILATVTSRPTARSSRRASRSRSSAPGVCSASSRTSSP